MQSILFITTANLTTNPRLVKEVILAVNCGFTVSVLACNIGGWSQELDTKIVQQVPSLHINYLAVHKNQSFVNWLYSNCMHHAAKLLFKLGYTNNRLIVAYAFERRTILLHQKLQKIKGSYKWVIAHNPGAFFPAYQFAQKNKCKLGIDIEDYHPGEKMEDQRVQQVTSIMQHILPAANYVSYAAPLIREAVESNFLSSPNNIVINNVFHKEEFVTPVSAKQNDTLKLVWFSQYIDYGRGLEEILSGLDKVSLSFTLTLIGDCRENFYEHELKKRVYVRILKPMLPKDLHKALANYHVGLAVENAATDTNRNICLTNKIWSYAQAGLYVVATPTAAQIQLAAQYPKQIFLLHHSNDLNDTINQIKEELQENHQLQFFSDAQENIHWQQESKKLVPIWTA